MLCIFTSMQYHNVLMSSKAVFFSVVLSLGRIVMPRDCNINTNALLPRTVTGTDLAALD